MSKFTAKTFTSSGSWVCPAGITRVMVRLYGGGAGGESGAIEGSQWLAGGCSAELVRYVTVVPGTTYIVTIGAGGSGGVVSPFAAATSGGNTTFDSLITGLGASSFADSGNVANGHTPIIDSGSAPYGAAASGTHDTVAESGYGGYNGSGGSGGAGGNASDAGTAGNGSNAAANSGGGGGSGGHTVSGTAGNGGNGGSGYLEVVWVE